MLDLSMFSETGPVGKSMSPLVLFNKFLKKNTKKSKRRRQGAPENLEENP